MSAESPIPGPERSEPPHVEEMRRLREAHAVAIRALHLAIRDTTRLTRLFYVLSEPAPLAQLLDRVLATLSELFMADIVVLLEATPTGAFTPLAAVGLPVDALRAATDGTESSHGAAALQQRGPVIVAQVSDDSDVELYLRDLNAETAVWLPVHGDDGPRGVLMLARCRPEAFARPDVDLLMSMAYRVGVMLDRVHAEQARHQLELGLARAEKAESLARMAGAITHLFNNLLGAVVGSIDLATAKLPEGHPSREDAERAKRAALRASETNGLILAYLGQNAVSRQPIELVQTIRDGLHLLRTSLPPAIQLTAEWPSGELVVLADARQIAEALTHLVTNAVESIGSRSGEIRVALRAVAAADIPAAPVASAEPQPAVSTYACLSVSDSGSGIPADVIDKIFDPFFTTKVVGRGLGLPVVLGTVRAHDGFVRVESSVGRGTTVRVFLPAIDRPAVAPPAPPQIVVPPSAERDLVLIADDEQFVLITAERVLVWMGYRVVTAADGVEAVERFREHQARIRFVLLDLTMPRMDGWQAFDAMRAIDPDVPAILVSGYDASHALANRPPTRALFFLHKPFGIAELSMAVECVTGAPPPPA